MLVLTRKCLEKIQIGDDICITIMDIKGRQVKIGIEAPTHVCVYREELYRKIQEENMRASRVELSSIHKVKKVFEKKR